MDVLAKEYRDDLCILVDMLKEMILFPYDMAYTMYWKDKSSDSCNEQSACPYNPV